MNSQAEDFIEKLSNKFKPGDHGSTFGGNPVFCAAAIAVLDTIGNETFYKSVEEKGNLIKKLITDANLDQVVEVRGRGLMIGIQVKCNPSDIQKKAVEKGVLVLTAGKDVIRLLPPLTISEEEIKFGIETLIELLK